MTKKTGKLVATLFLSGVFLLGAVGCGHRPPVSEDSSVASIEDITTTTQDSTTMDNTTISTKEHTTTVTTTTATAVRTTTSRTTKDEPTVCPTAPPPATTTSTTVPTSASTSTAPSSTTTTTTTTTTKQTTTTATVPPPAQDENLTKWELPQVVRQTGTEYGHYDRVIRTDDGRIVAIGKVKTTLEDNTDSVIDVYDEDLVLQNSYHSSYLDGYQLIACADGGFLMDCRDHLQKFSAQLDPEWSLYLLKPSEHVSVAAMTQLSDGAFAVVYRKPHSELEHHMAWYLALFTEEGQALCQMDLKIRDSGCEDPALISDEKGGFYLVMSVSPEDTGAPGALRQALDSEKGREVAMIHYVPNTAKDAAWRIDSVQSVGGIGDEWCEEAAMDAQGNFYIALGNHGKTTDPFWGEMVYGDYFRRMLVKVTPEGKVVYRVPLSGRSMAVDQVFGIHVRDGQVCVTGVSAICDGVLDPYVADSLTEQDRYYRYAVYAATVDENGTLLSRRVFEYDQLEMGTPDGSVWLSDGRLLIGGAVCVLDNFNLDFPEGTHSNRALFIYR